MARNNRWVGIIPGILQALEARRGRAQQPGGLLDRMGEWSQRGGLLGQLRDSFGPGGIMGAITGQMSNPAQLNQLSQMGPITGVDAPAPPPPPVDPLAEIAAAADPRRALVDRRARRLRERASMRPDAITTAGGKVGR